LSFDAVTTLFTLYFVIAALIRAKISNQPAGNKEIFCNDGVTLTAIFTLRENK